LNTLFLSFHFDGANKTIAEQVNLLVTSHGLRTVTGEHLAGGGVSETVKRRIEASDALIAIALADPARPVDVKFDTFRWVYDEIGYARGKDKRVAVLVPSDVDLGAGMHGDAERIAYDAAAPLPAFLKLSETIGIWKSEAGRMATLMLMSEDLATQLNGDLESGACRYRIHPAGDEEPGAWSPVRLRGEIGGILARAKGLKDGDLIEVEVRVNGVRWYSRYEPQLIKVEMKR